MYLLTRPVPKLQTSVAAFADAGLVAVGIAPIDIQFDVPVCEQLRPWLNRTQADALIITSTFAADALLATEFDPGLLPPLIAVGSSTATRLAAQGLDVMIPEHQDSDGVLSLALLQQAKKQRLVIIKGRGGRTLIADSLREAGNQVVEMPVYFRQPLATPVTTNDWQWTEVKGIITTSAEMAQAMFECYSGESLRQRPWLAVSERVAHTVRELGVPQVQICEGASDESLINWVKENWE